MKPRRNDPCPCGSGRKYKQCCDPNALRRDPVQAQGDIGPLVALYDAGRYADAERGALVLLGRSPESALAWQLLGAARRMQGRDGVNAFRKAVDLLPDDALAHSNLGAALTDLGRFGEAVASYGRAIEIDPGLAEAHFNRGNALQACGQDQAAADSYRRALELEADWSEAHNSLGAVLERQHDLGAALACYRRAVEVNPGNPRALANLACLLSKTGHFDEAAQCFRRALPLRPDDARTWSGLGAALTGSGHIEDALPCLYRATELEPASAKNHFNFGLVLYQAGRLAAAEKSYRRALEIDPGLAAAHNNLGVCLRELGHLDDGLASCRRAIELTPDSALAWNNLGLLCKDAGRLDQALASYRRATELDPDYTQARSNLVYLLSFHPGFDQRAQLNEARAFGDALAARAVPVARMARAADASGRVRIGYVSPDFRDHCQSLFTLPLLSHHDRTRFETFCYSDVVRPDAITARLRGHVDVWRETAAMGDDELAAMIAGDGIDILVDLTMHMAKGRPRVFSRKPAPVQVAWLAYPGTTGLPAMDYRLSDPWLDPPERGDEPYSERTLRLPHSFWCYDPLAGEPCPNPLPVLATGHVTFGCLNNFCKLNDATLQRWGRVMAHTPGSRLLLLAPAGSARQRVVDVLRRCQVSAERVEFVDHRPRADYLRLYHRIDLCLDTDPYNGHTTSLDAYWMGVPVVTRVGATVVGRAGWSQVNNLGLTELAAFDDDGFVEAAVTLAQDLERLDHLRGSLRQRMAASPLMDAARFATDIEAAFLALAGRSASAPVDRLP